MKVGRIVGIVLLVLLVLYLLLFHTANPVLVGLPWLSVFIPPLPVSYIVVLALIVGFLSGWLPSRLLAWRRGREVKRLEKRLAELTPAPSVPAAGVTYQDPAYPVIPDRAAQHDPYAAASGTYDGSYDAAEDEAG
ncbi:MAG: LapA family protein [Trueperaceae bacterium]